MAPDIDRLVGPEYLKELRRTHTAFGEALGTIKRREAGPAPVSLSEPLRALSRAVQKYALCVAVMANDSAKLSEVRAAPSPIDDHREGAARRAAANPAAPVPELPPEPPQAVERTVEPS